MTAPAAARTDLEVLEGLHCASCVVRLEGALTRIPGVAGARVNLATREAQVDYAPAEISPAAIADPPRRRRIHRARTPGEPDAASRPRTGIAVGIALAIAAVVMALAMLGPQAAWNAWAQAALTLALALGPARPILRSAAIGLARLAPDMDALVAIGAAAFALSATLVATGSHHLYFELAAMILALVLFGRWLEERARVAAGAAVRALLARRPATAVTVRDGAELEVPLAAVRVGDLLRLRPGAAVPTDGVVVAGATEIDEALLTGEGLPVAKATGDRVIGGTINGQGTIDLRAERVGADTALARLARSWCARRRARSRRSRASPTASARCSSRWSWRSPSPPGSPGASSRRETPPPRCWRRRASWSSPARARSVSRPRPRVMVAVAARRSAGWSSAPASRSRRWRASTPSSSTRRARSPRAACASPPSPAPRASPSPRPWPWRRGWTPVRNIRLPRCGSPSPRGPATPAPRFRAIPGPGAEATIGERRLRIGTVDFAAEIAPRAAIEALSRACPPLRPSPSSPRPAARSPPSPSPTRSDRERPRPVARLRARGLDLVLLSGDRREAVAAVAEELGIATVAAGSRPKASSRRCAPCRPRAPRRHGR